MNFKQRYEKIKETTGKDFEVLESDISNLFQEKSPLNKHLLKFLTSPSKRIRPLLGFLFLRSISNKINKEQYKILLAVELVHNATLIHDDIMDNASVRRKQKTLNTKFDNDLAVVAGDYLLSMSLEKVIETNSSQVLKLFTSAIKQTCLGEIRQYFTKNKITSIEEYIEKSRQKTALLFEMGVLGGFLLSEKSQDKKLKQTASDFAQNFGIAFQIRDDLMNVLNMENNAENDFQSGVFTAPLIFAQKENKNILKKNVFKEIQKTDAIEKTKTLMNNYFEKAIFSMEKIAPNKYKTAIKELIEILKESI
ncbi:MAG TPA: polyprenyl synthetase family protein [Candidatus Gastranaerophilaceae bacterium]|nr:polyprenyl synthetase family protein [Candidatus Gastranaerophilaceae bacterium]HPT42073.1 polyprenyl synthetase family protein [Candidatus Gastranaerophilaceae bacterium]